jgi:RHS repeat-associated protein
MKIFFKKYALQIRFLVLFIFAMESTPNIATAQVIELSTPVTGEFSSNESIRLLPGFQTTGPFHAFITGNLNLLLNSSPSADQNYVRTRTVKQAGAENIPAPTVNQISEVMNYYDGLGRPLQIIQTMGSPRGNDIVQPFVYDAFGRQQVQYLPYAETTGGAYFKASALGNQATYYSGQSSDANVVKTTAPYSQTLFEASPLNRVAEQGAPGTVWQPAGSRTTVSGRTLSYGYTSNDASVLPGLSGYGVRLWTAQPIPGSDYKRTLNNNGYYAAGQLYLKIFRDENWTGADGKAGTIEEYTDMNDRLVLKRTFDAGSNVYSTYYVYDDLGNLSYVLPPGAAPDGGSISQTVLDQFCYQYRYDEKQRLIEKRIPGKDGWTTLVYNLLDQVVFTQDTLQRLHLQTSFTKYDGLGRVIMTGIGLNSTDSRTVTQNGVMNWPSNWEHRDNAEFHGYSNTSVPSSVANMDVETVNYYDDYAIVGLPVNESASFSNKTQGLLTASKVKVLGTGDYLWTINYYDEEGRVAKQYKQHYQTGAVNAANYDEITNTYNFEGELTASTRIHHHVSGGATTISNRYEYDQVGRKLRSYEKINTDAEVLLTENKYNEVGQLRSKTLHDGIQNTSFSYNERGWLKGSSSAQFSFQLAYQDGATPQYNGNISGQLWGAGSSLGSNFTYEYDKLNRLTSGIATGMSEILSYDAMGNILSLNRDGAARTYTYSGNRLSNTNGAAGSWANQYDANGNMIYDGRLGQAVIYNTLNLPASVAGLGLAYTYDATGNKLKKSVSGNVKDYIDGIQYTNGSIELIQTETGVARRNGGSYSYEHNLTDHLGNVRYTFYRNPVNGQAERLQSDDYYPFGLRKSSGSSISLNNKYLYNGKELQEEPGTYDYGFRQYDPVIARWNVADPLQWKHTDLSPYNYVMNNPMLYIDPLGLDTIRKGSTATIKPKDIVMTDDGKAIESILPEFNVTPAQSNPWITAASLTFDWALGIGKEQRTFANDNIANSFKDSRIIGQARNYWYKEVNAERKTIYDGLTNFMGEKAWTGGNFGYSGLKSAGLDPMEQFVGSFTPEISSDGVNLKYTIENTTSMRSLFYGRVNDWKRSTWAPGGNMKQQFIFTEPINFNKINRFK